MGIQLAGFNVLILRKVALSLSDLHSAMHAFV